MRKDVRIGLAIAGVLIVLLIVYAIIPHRTSTTKTVVQNTETPQVEVGVDTPPSDTEAATPETPSTPVKSKDPFGPAEPSTAKSNGTDVNHSTDPSSVTDASSGTGTGAGAGSNVNWNQLLYPDQSPRAEGGKVAPVLYAKATPTSPIGGTTGVKSAEPRSSEVPKTDRRETGSEGSTRLSKTTSEKPPLVPATPASGDGARTHVIQKGETLSSISEIVYGSSKFYTLIQKANPEINDRFLKVGTNLKIPDRTESASSTSTSSKSGSAVGSSGAPSLMATRSEKSTPTRSADSAKEYRVQQGDTLYGIAVKLYGKGNRVHKLAELNKSLLGNDPDSLKIGMVLKLPEPPTMVGTASR